MTRDELDRAITRLADRLQRLDVAGQLIGVFVERDRDTPICLLAIQAARAAYLPLESRHPDERIRTVLSDAAPACVITTAALRDRLPEDLPVIVLDRPASDPAAIRAGLTDPDLAYVIFTSGSMGRPKGVAISDESLELYLRAMDEAVGSSPNQVWQWLASIAFDSTIIELMWPLTRGHLVCLRANDPLSLLESPLVEGTAGGLSVTTVLCTPSLARVLISDPDGLAALRKLDLILFGGEPFPLDVVDRLWASEGTRPRVMNAYGPTEATVAVTFYTVEEHSQRPIPIGDAIASAQLHVLDQNLLPTQSGTPGVLFISGRCLSKGYWRRPDLTAQRFVTISTEQGDTIAYDTGDTAVQYPHGIVIIGRADDQVKVRGNRVELGEIEQMLQTHPQINAAVCITDAADGFATEIRAVLVSNMRDPDIREWLMTRLPTYMIPAHFIFRESLPLTASGKIDRDYVRNKYQS